MHRQEGFTYVVVMFLVAVLSIASVRALQYTRMTEQREKETELLWVGTAYRNAIAAYYNESQGSTKQYPQQLGALLKHELTNPTRPLRKLYRDPISGSKDWGIVRNEAGAVIGVYSLSQQRPLKREGFPLEMAGFANAQRYSDWKFVYQPVN
jgi:type II secretory pathway pseudopilin PulG